MPPIHQRARHVLPILLVTCTLFLFAGWVAYSQPAQPAVENDTQAPTQAIQSAWRALGEADGYSFTTQVSQETSPAPMLGNVGRTPSVASLYLEGQIDRGQQALNLWLWDGVHEAYAKDEALQVKIEGDRAFGRIGDDGVWQEVDNIAALVAPGMDVAAYLAGARHISSLGIEQRQLPDGIGGMKTVSFSGYSFILNGQAVSDYTNDQINAVLQERGELPPGLELQTGSVFDHAHGRGELWVDGSGLPARMRIDIEFPQESSGERVSAVIQTDFQDYVAPTAFALPAIGQIPGMLAELAQGIAWQRTGVALSALFLLALLIVITRRKPLAYRVISLFMVAQMTLSPVASIAQANNEKRQIDTFLADRSIAADGIEATPAARVPTGGHLAGFDTTQSPLALGQANYAYVQSLASSPVAPDSVSGRSAVAAAVAMVDTDEDGLEDSQEVYWGADPGNPDSDSDGLKDGQEASLCEFRNPWPDSREDTTCAHPAVADTDGDGLSDGQELLYLGTQPNRKDSDLDGIEDKAEVEGFGNPVRYTDPRNPDTDEDGRLDGEECPERTREKGSPGSCRDTDGDGFADVFDDDSDNDGFFDTVDSAPAKSIGTRNNPPFNGVTPFHLTVRNVLAGKQVLVDFQVRPEDARLSYPTSVLDWPSGDTSGQVQRRLDTTFAQVWNSPDPALANGDMRVVPMLELSMQSSQAPLPRTTARFNQSLVSVVPLGNVQLIDNADDGRVEIRLSSLDKRNGESYSLSVKLGTCQTNIPLGNAFTFANVDGQQTYVIPDIRLNGIASGGHVLVLSNGTESICEPIGVAPENTQALPFLFQRQPRSLGSVDFAQNGSDIAINFAFSDPAAVFALDVRAGSCAERGSLAFSRTGLSQSAPSYTEPGKYLTQIADAEHILILKETTQGNREVFCQPLPNLVNGGVLETMIDTDYLTHQFNISVHEADEAGNLVAYVPATTIVDDRSGRTAGFGGRMAFDTTFGTLLDAQVRLIWHVQVLTDFCSDPPADFMNGSGEQQRLAAWCGDAANQLQVVHQYADPGWTLAGLTVREDHSLALAALFEDPSVDDNTESDDRLWHLADGLSGSFLDGRDCDSGAGYSDCARFGADGSRDLTARMVYDRFRQGSATLAANAGEAKWGLTDGVLDARWYETDSSVAFGDILETDIPLLLDQTFLDGSGNPNAIAPLVLYAAEESFRSTELDLAGNSATNGNSLLVDFNVGGLAPVTVTTLNWKPYRRTANNSGWEAYPLDDYWGLLEQRLSGSSEFTQDSVADGDLIRAGEIRISQILFTSLYGGRSGLVQVGSQIVNPTPVDSVSDAARLARYEAATGGANTIKAGALVKSAVSPVATSLARQYLAYTNSLKPLLRENHMPLGNFDAKEILRTIGDTIKNKTKSNWNNFLGDAIRTKSTRGKSGVRIGIFSAGLTIAAVAGQGTGFGAIASQTLSVVTLAANISTLVSKVSAVTSANSSAVVQGVTAAARISKTAGQVAGAVALLVGEAIAWGALIYTIVAANLTAGSLAANKLAANGIAGSVVASALLALALAAGPIGAIAAAVIAVIDSLIALTCGFIPDEVKEDNVGVQYFCKGLTGLLAEAISYVIYASQDIVTVDDPYRMQIVQFSPALKNPQTGFIVNAPVLVDITVRNTLQVSKLPASIGSTYPWQYSEDNLKESAFVYAIVDKQETDEEKELHTTIGTISDPCTINPILPGCAWTRLTTDPYDTRHGITRKFSEADTVKLGATPGLNRPVKALLAEGYAIPTQECILIYVPVLTPVPVPTCWVRERRDTNYINLGIEFDVFPATLADFMALTEVGNNRFAQSWGQVGTLRLPLLRDADGDGLPAEVDSNDRLWDADGDLISDQNEIEQGTSPDRSDSDSDGLRDWEELLRKTNPTQVDSDGDGLSDGDEVTGWEVEYAQNPARSTLVMADPRQADADGDLLLDAKEKNFGYNPFVINDRTALQFETAISEPYAPDLILTLDEAAGAVSYTNSADKLGETSVVCKNDKAIGYNASIAGITVDMGSLTDTGDMVLVLNGVETRETIKPRNSNGKFFLFPDAIPIATDEPAEETLLHWELRHQHGLGFSTPADWSISDHRDGRFGFMNVRIIDFRGPGDALINVLYLITKDDGHCPSAGMSGYYGSAAAFDGVGDALIVSGNNDLAYLSRHFVIGAYINPDHVTGRQTLVSTKQGTHNNSGRGSFEFGLNGSDLFFEYRSASNGTVSVDATGASIAPNWWNYIQLELDTPDWSSGQGTVRMYVNGALVKSQAVTDLPDILGNAGVMIIGGSIDIYNQVRDPFAGLLDELVVVALPEGSPISAARAGLAEGLYNPDDGLLARSQTVQINVGVDNKLSSSQIRGFHYVDFPDAVFGLADANNELFLEPRAGTRVFDGLATVKADAPAGNYQLSQSVEAVAAVPTENLWSDPTAGEVFPWPVSADFDGTYGIDFRDRIVPLPGDFTISVWIKPGAPENQRRGILGRASHTPNGYPSLEIQNNRLYLGYGDGSTWQEIDSSQTLTANAWNFVAVTLNDATNKATFYVNSTGNNSGVERNILGSPNSTLNNFFIGRSRDLATLTISQIALTCEYDAGGTGEYDLLASDGTKIYGFEGTDGDVKSEGWAKSFSGTLTVSMCEDDDGDRTSCGGSDDIMGELTVSANAPSTLNGFFIPKVFTSRPADANCTWDWGSPWPDTALVHYRVDNPSIPFIGTIQGVRIFNTIKSQPQIDALRRGNRYIADFRLDEIPGSDVFNDFSSFHQATCDRAGGRCPVSGVDGRDEQAVFFDGVDDFLSADSVSAFAATATDLTFGAWIKPEQAAGSRTVVAFNTSGRENRNMIYIRDEGGNSFKVGYFDNNGPHLSTQSFSKYGQWIHVAVTLNKTTGMGKLFVDTNEEASFSTTVRPDPNGLFSIGQEWDPGGTSEHFKGVIDRVFVVNESWDSSSFFQLILERNKAPSKRYSFEADWLGNTYGDQWVSGAGIRGAAIRFAGNLTAVEDLRSANAFDEIQRNGWTSTIWVKPEQLETGSPGYRQPIWRFGSGPAWYVRLVLVDGVPTAELNAGGYSHSAVASRALVPNVWQQITTRWTTANNFEFYINGFKDSSTPGWIASWSNTDKLTLACDQKFGECGLSTAFQGMMDEFTIYPTVLTDREIREQFNRQNAWLEDREEVGFIVSTEPVQVILPIAEGTYFPQENVQVLINTASDYAPAVKTDLSLDGNIRTPGMAVLDAAPGTAWMATFVPIYGEGQYTIAGRATDQVGKRTDWSSSRTVYVDGTPPNVTLNPVTPQPARLDRSPTDDGVFVMPLGGAISDPVLAGTAIPGSGVTAVEVTVYNAATRAAMAGTQRATVSGGNWSIDYLIPADSLTGEYVVDVVAEDGVGNRSTSAVVSQLRSSAASQTVQIDTTAPHSTISTVSMKAVQAAQSLVDSPPEWLGPESVIAGSVDETPTTAVEHVSFAGVQSVEVVFEPVDGSGSALRHAPLPASTLLYLPFDESKLTVDNSDKVFTDLVAGHTARCVSSECPEAGGAAPLGQSLLFDGVDDHLLVEGVDAITSKTANLTLAAWMKPAVTSGMQRILMTGDGGDNGFGFGLRGDTDLVFSAFGVKDYYAVHYFDLNRWVHVAVTLDAGGNPSFYINGRLIETQTAAGAIIRDPDTYLQIGRDSDNSGLQGAVDEVAVFGQALTQAQIVALMGDGPTLHAPFDERSVYGDATLHDASWLHSEIRRSDAASLENGAVQGVVGAHALDFSSVAGHRLTIASAPGALPLGNEAHTISGWFKIREKAELLPSRIQIGGGANAHEIIDFYAVPGQAYAWAGSYDSQWVFSDFAANSWQHFAITWDGSLYSTWWNGVRQNTSALSPFNLAETPQIELFDFEGELDDFKVFRRALSAAEIAELATTGWRTASVNASGPGTETTTWNASPPDGLEGFYQLKSRATDSLGNFIADPNAEPDWTGTVDTIAPRTTSSKTSAGGSVVYTFAATDFDLNKDTLTLPGACTGNTTVTTAPYQSPWYLALAQQSPANQAALSQRTYTLTATCTLPVLLDDGAFRVCDVANNCTTVNWDEILGDVEPPAARIFLPSVQK